MGIEMIEKNEFYTFGRKMNGTDGNGEFRNFLPIFAAGAIVLGRKKKADKTRQEIADKYQSLRVDCDGIDSSISQVSNDLDSLKSSKPRKKKDERVWSVRLSETENVLRELQSAKRNLICTKDVATPPTGGVTTPPVVVKDIIPTNTPSGTSSGNTGTSGSSASSGTSLPILDSPPMSPSSRLAQGLEPMSTGDGGVQTAGAAPKKNMILYIVLGIAVLGGVVYFVRKN